MRAFTLFAYFAVATIAISTPNHITTFAQDASKTPDLQAVRVQPLGHALPATMPVSQDSANDMLTAGECPQKELSAREYLCKTESRAKDSAPRATADISPVLFLTGVALGLLSVLLTLYGTLAVARAFVAIYCGGHLYSRFSARFSDECAFELSLWVEDGIDLDDEEADKPYN